MKRNRFGKIFTFLAAMIGLSSCTIFDLLPGGGSSAGNPDDSRSIGSSDLNTENVLPFSLRDMSLSLQCDVLPATGDLNLLVLPIEFTDSPFTKQTLTDLEIALNGTPEETGYWESVSSFYEKSSFGKSRLHYEIAPIYKTGQTQKALWSSHVSKTYNGYTSDNAAGVIGDAYNDYIAKQGNNSTMKFDSDQNGWIDGVVAIYSGHNCTNMRETYDMDAMFYWAYTYWTVGAYEEAWTQPNRACPTPNLYIWMSYDFFYEATSSPKVDAHTLIHETGHMYGLDDYYSTGRTCLAGSHDMMDGNVTAHDVLSKMLLGWVKPHVVTDPETIDILPSQTSGDCILIPGENWNGTAYDEYILMELYTPEGLNALDSRVRYPGREKAYTKAGIKLYHVDARVMELSQDLRGNLTYAYLKDPQSGMKENTSKNAYGYSIAASNCYKQSWEATGYSDDYALIHMIEANNVYSFATGSAGTNAALFTEYSFSFKDYRKFFLKRDSTKTEAVFNSGNRFPYKVYFDVVDAYGATIRVESI